MYLQPMILPQPTLCMCIAKHPPTIILATNPLQRTTPAHSSAQTNQLKKHAWEASYLQNTAKHPHTCYKKDVKMHTYDITTRISILSYTLCQICLVFLFSSRSGSNKKLQNFLKKYWQLQTRICLLRLPMF